MALLRSHRPFAILGIASLLYCQQPPVVPPGFGPRAAPAQPAPAPAPAPPQPAPAKPAPAGPKPPAGQPAPAQQPAAPQAGGGLGGLSLQNASLVEVVDQLARVLHINYILDPRVKGGVILNTYGEVRDVDARALLDTILRINNAAMVKVGEMYRIVPMADVARLPLKPQVDAKDIPENDQVLLNLVFLKYATVDELQKLLAPFIGEGAQTIAYPPANLLLILDSGRNMRRTMELVSLFDSDVLASQRVRLFEVKNSRPTDIAKELEKVMKAVSLSGQKSSIQFLPIDRINTVVAIAPNPGVFDEIEKWLKRLDIEVKVTAGSVDNYVYRVKYGRADMLASAIMQLYGGFGMMGGYGMGMYGGGMYGGGMYGGYGGGMYGGGYGGYGGGMYGGYGGYGYGGPMVTAPMVAPPVTAPATGTAAAGSSAAGTDQTGSYLGSSAYGYGPYRRIPQIVPNPMDNSLLIQATKQEYEQILKLLESLDIPPRQVLIEAKIYEVSLTGAFASGVAAFFQKRGANGKDVPQLETRNLVGNLSEGALNLSAGALVGQSRELLGFLRLQETEGRTKVISAPSVIATDSIPASINVGTEVPTLTAQAVTGVQSGGNSLFANTITSRSTGVTLNILARVNPSGIVTLVINQEVSAPLPPAPGAIQSPSFSKRTVQTQVTLQDGDTIAIGGIISESNTSSSSGVPVLHRIPILGYAFGSRSTDRERSELVIFLTPKVIYDTNQIVEASDELKSGLKRLMKIVRE
jgi:general secretion pathway protein D